MMTIIQNTYMGIWFESGKFLLFMVNICGNGGMEMSQKEQ